nr:hypothetical protein [Tanacetum cinerariifolium]
MARLQFCDYHNMVAILEKGEFNSDFHPMVDFIAASPLRIETTDEGTHILAIVDASPLRYALTVKPTIFVSHIRQFWSTARIETTDEGTHILATVDGIQRNVSESSFRRNLKLRDENDIVSIPDTELFESLTLMGIVSLLDTMLVHQGEGSGTPTEPHHTPFPKADTSHTTTSSIPLPSIPTAPITPVTQPDPTPIRQYSRRARIAQSFALLTVADEPASPVRDVSEREACPTDSGFIAYQVRATIDKSSTLPYDSAPRVTSPAADEGSMQHTIFKLTALCTSLQRQYSELLISRDAEVARIHAEEELQGMIDSLEKSNETIAKYLQEYQDFALELTLEKRIELISDLVKYQDNYSKVYKFQSQQRRPMTKKQKREYYMAMIRNNLGWRVKDFKGMTFKEIKAKFAEVWKQVKDFIPIGSKEENERLKRKGLKLEQEQVNKQKSSEEAHEIETSTEEFTEEKVKEMM